ncbi:MAG: PQQ-dependent sugar dehydrogenase [Caldilineaceae bacterium]
MFIFSACGRSRNAPPATENPQPTATNSRASQALPLLDRLADVELLGTPNLIAQCDHPADVQLTCQNEATHPLLAVNAGASSYARWSLAFGAQLAADFTPLTGVETLYLHVRRTGNLTPNLYLVERDGDRIPVRLGAFGLRDGWGDVHIPLAEIADDEGKRPDFANIVEVQLVFEWADMSGELEIDSLRFASVWREPVTIAEKSVELAHNLQLDSGFAAMPIADGLSAITQIQFAPNGDMLVSLQTGRVWWYADSNGDGQYDERHLYAAGLAEVVGLLYDPTDGAVWLGGRGQLVRTFDSDQNGVADQYEVRIDGLPWGRHQNNTLVWNPDPDPFTGESGAHWIYLGLGSTEDLEVGGPFNAAILRFPRDGQGEDALEIVSKGNRNPYAIVWGAVPVNGEPTWQLFASENGPDFNDASDEVNHIRWHHHYGFPTHFGSTFDQPADTVPAEIDGWPYSGALYDVTPHASASGLAYVSNPAWPAAYQTLYVSLFGQVFSEGIVGHTVERITLTPVETDTGLTFRGEPSVFIAGLDRPLPMMADHDGNLIVGDYATGVVYRISFGE